MDLLNATVAQMTAYFMERWGKAGGHTRISDHDLSAFDLSASARKTPDWQKATIEIALRELGETETVRSRLHKAIMIAVERGIDVPPSVQTAQPASTDPVFKNLENRYYYLRRHLEHFPDIDPHKPHNLEMMCDAIIVGRFDVAAQIFMSAENKTRREWIRKLRLD